MVFLAGEVVVDYAVRLKQELDWSRLWINAWANDMPGYIPSRRVLEEGGYEADFSQVYYEQPGRYDPGVEDKLVQAVRELVGEPFEARADQEPSPYHKLPSGEALTFKRLASWVNGERTKQEIRMLQKLRDYVQVAQPAVGVVSQNGGEETEWFNYAGDHDHRRFIRQLKIGTELDMVDAAGTENHRDILWFIVFPAVSGGKQNRKQMASRWFLTGGKAPVRRDTAVDTMGFRRRHGGTDIFADMDFQCRFWRVLFCSADRKNPGGQERSSAVCSAIAR